MLVSFAFRLEVYCKACRIALPVNGVVPSLTCYHCGERNELDGAWWHATLSPDRLRAAYFDGPQELSRANEFELAYRTWNARCEPCKGRDLDLVAVGSAVAAGAGHVPCPDCGREIATRAADDLARAIDPHATLVVGERTAATVEARSRPVILRCAACDAALPVDGSARTVACRFCEASNYLPDGLWRELNPVPKVVQWFLVADYDADALRALRWRDESVRWADARSSITSPEELAMLAADRSQRVRLAVAKNVNTPRAALAQLAADPDADVASAAREPRS